MLKIAPIILSKKINMLSFFYSHTVPIILIIFFIVAGIQTQTTWTEFMTCLLQ